MRRAESGKRRHQMNAAAVRYLVRQRFDIGRFLDNAETIAEPLHHRAGDEDTALESVLGALSCTPRDGSEKFVLGSNRFGARLHEHKAAGAISILHHAGLRADLTEQRRLLIACDPGNWDWVSKKRGGSIHFARGTHLGQRRTRNLEKFQQLVIPIASVNIKQHGARGIARVRHVVCFRPGRTRYSPQHIDAHGASALHVFENPL